MKHITAFITFQEDSDIVKKGDSCTIELPDFKGYEPDYTEPNREHIKTFYGQLADSECSVVFDFEMPLIYQDKSELVLRWVKASERLPQHDEKVFVEWQGFYDEHGEYFNRGEIEEKLRDESVVGIQWLEKFEKRLETAGISSQPIKK